ncbi:MAG: DUF1080 domain-containing protein [Chitinophagaceae bacterium]|nr:DUF1080 domain-containing protein [Chitinophagaceae bacterium]MCW5926477.1 DUF1080 domain-containing protein [Chitinophagaceae bacterium]
MFTKKSSLTILMAMGIGFTMVSCGGGEDKKETAGDGASAKVFVEIFDGKTLNGWEADTSLWRVEDGVLVGEIKPGSELKKNSFIIWRGGETKDFELVAEYNITEAGNSGINYRSELVPDVPFALKGYQADIDGGNVYTGQNYEERGRTIIAFRGQRVILPATDTGKSVHNIWNAAVQETPAGDSDSLKALIKSNDWNEIRIIARGNSLKHYINGALTSEVTDDDTVNRKMSGLLGFQVHVGPPMKIQYRNIRYKEL